MATASMSGEVITSLASACDVHAVHRLLGTPARGGRFVGDGYDIGALQPVKVAHDVGTPVSVTDCAKVHHIAVPTEPDNIVWLILSGG